MAKKKEELSFDDDDFNFDFDETGSGGFQSGKQKAGRRAVVEFTGSFLSGIKKSLLNPANQRKILEQNAPAGFTTAFDAVSDVKRASKEIYSETKDEFFKNLGDVDQDVKTITGKWGKYASPRLVDRVEAMAERTASRTFSDPHEDEQNELNSGLDGILAGVAKSQRQSTLLNKKNSVESTGQIVASQASTTTAVLTANKILSNISRNTDIMVGLNTAQAKLQRKSVELTYSQVVIQRQMLDVLQQTKDLQTRAFEALIKNTGLPEHIKATLWEETNRSFKARLVGMATERATSRLGDMFGTAVERIKEKSKMNAGGMGGTLAQILGGLSMYADMGDMMGSRSSRAGAAAGGAAGAALQLLLRRKLGDKFKNDPRFKVYGNNIQNLITTMPGMFNKLQDEYGSFRSLTELLGIGDLKVDDFAMNTKVRGNGIKDLDAHQAYNRKAHLALTEVIPGHLTNMTHLLEIISSGNPNVARRVYDWEKGTFTTEDKLKDRTIKSMYNQSQIRDSRGRAHQIVNALDSKNELSKKDRAILMRYVMEQANSSVGYIDPAALTNLAKSPIANIDSDAATRIANVLSNSNNFANGDQILTDQLSGRSRGIFDNNNKNIQYQDRMANANSLLGDLRISLPNGMRTAIERAETGNMEMLRDTGLVIWDKDAKEWRFDNKKYMDVITSGRMPPGFGPNSGGRGNAGPPTPPRPMGGGSGSGNGGGGSGGSSNIDFSPSPSSSGGGGVGVDGYTQFQRDLLEAIELNSAKTSVDVSNQVLEAIRQRLDLGIPQGGAPESEQDVRRKSSIFRRLLNATSRVKGAGKSFVTRAMQAQLRIAALPFKMFTGSINAGASVGASLFRNAFKGRAPSIISNTSKRFAKMMGDVYIQGKESAAMKMADIQSGQYRDKVTGKVIQSLKDIKGAVVDAAGNIVITEEDFRQGIYTLINGKRFSILRGALTAGATAVKGFFQINTLPVKAFQAVTGAAYNAFSRLRSASQDIYVAGEISPRLLSRVMAAGGYFTRDGKVIKSLMDITGDVLDAQGNVVLTVSEMSKGLIDKYGKPFRGALEKIITRITAPIRFVKNVGTKVAQAGAWLAKLNLRAIKSPFKLGKSIASMIGGNASPDIKISAHTADTVDSIYALLDARLPRPKGSWNDRDGSGHRDGSREDVLGRGRPGGPAAPDTPTTTASSERRGIMGMLMAMVGGIGTVIGTMRSWFGNIFGMMRMAAQARAAGGLLQSLGGLLGGMGGRRGRGRGRGAGGAGGAGAASMMSRLKNFGRANGGRIAGITAIGAGALMLGNNAFAQSAMSGASSVLSGSDAKAFDANNLGIGEAAAAAGGVAGGSSILDAMTGGDGTNPLSMPERLMNGLGGSVVGELGAIAAFPLLAALYNKVQGTRAGGRILPGMQNGGGPANPPTSRTGKVMQFLTGTTKGRVLLAAITGAGFVGGRQLAFGTGGDSVASEATTSFGTTLGLELALATVLPALFTKGRSIMAARRQQQAAARIGPPQPVRGGSLSNTRFNPAQPQRAGIGVNSPAMRDRLATQPPPLHGPPRPPGAPGAPPIPPGGAPPGAPGRLGIMGRLAGFGKGIFANAGVLGTGLAAYDAYNTEGGMWEKAKAFGGSLLTTAAIGKGLNVAGRMTTQAGRAGLAQGARSMLAGGIGRQLLIQGGRTALMAVGSMLAGGAAVVSTPVVLTGLAIAAAGAGLYFGYKKFFGTDEAAIMRYRMAQYGVAHDDADKVIKIGQLEEICKKHVKISGDGATFNTTMPYKKILELYGVVQGDAEHTARFSAWFTQRFKPVFIKGLTAYRALTKSDALEKADELDKETKLKYLTDIGSLPDNTYAMLLLPFTNAKVSKYDAAKVKKEYERSKEKISHERGKGEKSLGEKAKSFAGGIVDKVKEKIMQPINFGRAVLDNGLDLIKNQATNALGFATNIATGNFGGAWNNVKQSFTNVGNAVTNTWESVKAMSGTNKEKYNKIRAAAIKGGDPHPDIVAAQWALESGWGKHQSGKNNYFGIKAVGNQPGTVKNTREVVRGKNVYINAKFADYPTLEAGIQARIEFIRRNPRYTKAGYYVAKTPLQAAQALLRAGYATDPNYVTLLCKIVKGCGYDPNAPSPTPQNPGMNVAAAAAAGQRAPAGVRNMAGQMMNNASANVPGMAKLPAGNGVLLPQYQKPAATGGAAPINAGIAIGGVPKNHRAVKAATIATQRAHPASTGWCARYVADALQQGGYKFVRQNSAYQYANGQLTAAGFTRINNGGQYQIGDVMVWGAHGIGRSGGAIHGHIQIFNGRSWVSDFIQPGLRPGPKYAKITPSLWRDSTLIGKVVTGSVPVAGAKPSNQPAKDTKADTKAPARPQAPAAAKVAVVPAAPAAKAAATPTAPVRPATPINKVSTPATDNAMTASNAARSSASVAATNEMVNIQKEQLNVQRAMLKTLGEIRNKLGAAAPTGQPMTQAQSQRANQMFGQSTKPLPISMDILAN